MWVRLRGGSKGCAMPTVTILELQQQIADLQRQILGAQQIRQECKKQTEPLLCLKASAQEIARLQGLLNVAQQNLDALSRIAGIWNIVADLVMYSGELFISAWDPQTNELNASVLQRGQTIDTPLTSTLFSPFNGLVLITTSSIGWDGTLNPTQPIMAGTLEGVGGNPTPKWTAERQTTISIHKSHLQQLNQLLHARQSELSSPPSSCGRRHAAPARPHLRLPARLTLGRGRPCCLAHDATATPIAAPVNHLVGLDWSSMYRDSTNRQPAGLPAGCSSAWRHIPLGGDDQNRQDTV
jgi:hypothetical protein